MPLPCKHIAAFVIVGAVGIFTLTAGNYFTAQKLYQVLTVRAALHPPNAKGAKNVGASFGFIFFYIIFEAPSYARVCVCVCEVAESKYMYT